ncbi:hypothetical protein PRIPAC_89743, partial [Pristionchus pacificus]
EDCLQLISDRLNAESRALFRKAHSTLARGVWRTENRLARRCIQIGATVPPNTVAVFASQRGLGINYHKIAEFDPFGSDLYRHAWQGPKNLTTTTLPEVKNNEGVVIRKQTTGLRPNSLLRGGVFSHAFAAASAKIDLDTHSVGISPWMMAEGKVRMTVRIRGVKTVAAADVTASSELRSLSGEHIALEVVSRREEEPIEGWGEDFEIVLATPHSRSTDAEKLCLALFFFSDFVLISVEIFAEFV